MKLQLLIKIKLLIRTKMLKKSLFAFKLSDVGFMMLINVEMPTIVDILTFMSMIKSMSSLVEYGNIYYLGLCLSKNN